MSETGLRGGNIAMSKNKVLSRLYIPLEGARKKDTYKYCQIISAMKKNKLQ